MPSSSSCGLQLWDKGLRIFINLQALRIPMELHKDSSSRADTKESESQHIYSLRTELKNGIFPFTKTQFLNQTLSSWMTRHGRNLKPKA